MSTSGRSRPRAVLVLALSLGSALLLLVSPAAGPAGASSGDGPPPVPRQVLAPSSGTPLGTPDDAALVASVRTALASPAFGTDRTESVIDATSGSPLMALGDTHAVLPASTLKIVTAVAALRAFGPDARLITRVVTSDPGAGASSTTDTGSSSATPSPSPTEIVLVGGGDATLSRSAGQTWPDGQSARPASLAELASLTAKALTGSGRRRVVLRVDDTLFTGPTTAPGWSPTYLASGIIAPVSALSVDQGRSGHAVGTSPRVLDPALAAGDLFAQRLRDLGITVTGPVARVNAPTSASATELARVVSPTMADLVERMLTQSDDDLAEALGHLAGGRLGGGASFEGGARASLKVLADLGVPAPGVLIADGSGLSARDRLPAQTLVSLIAAVVKDAPAALPGSDRPAPLLWPVLSGMPVAGVTGTLATRFDTAGTAVGRGVVTAKTGTLTGVNALAGVVRGQSGRLLAFAFIGAQSPGPQLSARNALDRAAAAVAAG